MGEVYKARDTRLSRDVAVKVLPAAFSADGERLQRFEQEARAAALNIPISSRSDLGTHDSAPYRVELLERAAQRPWDQGCRAESSGLRDSDCARPGRRARQGIVHHDLKPANIFITADGAQRFSTLGSPSSRARRHRRCEPGAYVASRHAAGVVPNVGYMARSRFAV
jgi:serine/threonine protein kinase